MKYVSIVQAGDQCWPLFVNFFPCFRHTVLSDSVLSVLNKLGINISVILIIFLQ